MKRLATLTLAATILTTPALAQTAPAGVTWQRGAAAAPGFASVPRMQPARPAAVRPNVVRPPMHRAAQRGVDRGHVRGGHRGEGRFIRRGDDRSVGRGPHRGPRHRHVQRFQRGFVLPSFWWGPQFRISNWSLYGFSQPFAGGHWMRHHDDAYLIDGYGRVHDTRYGVEWDRYGDDWAYDDQGVPIYGGGYGGGYGQDYGSYAPPPPPPHSMAPPPPHPHGGTCQPPAYGAYAPPPCGAAHAYAWGWGPMTITETTTVTTTPAVTQHTTYYVKEKVYAAAPKAKRKYRSKRRWK